ncbi:maleylacetoacetate isomerase [Paraburkholderia sp. BL27I4N3]|uniref:maleylacetoacetate isomerase n=1 Tax=Paraburkholderia sp. BL27I4N3 TaxID=1938805 RepID=UPI000E2438D1|nr:maleylacetoacetate isomerase [Paraburkholderia sp. BL27I4N3]REE07289.1 maleylacetoacetate isomerase [Paraburkholderia sp. BL27I4N3]
MKLYSYFRSSASYRVRIALNLKRLPYECVPVHLVRNGGEQFSSAYRDINPERLVPTLIDDSQPPITQSLAIIEYLDEIQPDPPLLPGDPAERAYVRSLSLQIACEIHPLNNLRVLKYLTANLGVTEEAKLAWYRHWVELGFESLETRLVADKRTGRFCVGDAPTMADLCLVPQIFNAQRFSVDVGRFPILTRINENAIALAAFAHAAPDQQPDAA